MSVGVTNLSVRLGSVLAVDDVTLATPPGQVTAVVGGDGAGKTTLLRAMVGRVAPSAGTIDVPEPRAIGYQPSSSGTWPDLTVDENLDFVGRMYGLSELRLRTRRDTLVERAGLVDARDRLASRLSGGMRTKLGFCMAMVHDPELLVLDEPSTGVDPVSRVELWRLLAESAADGTAVVLATTYMDEAERASFVMVLERGRSLLAGAPDDVVAASPGVVVATGHPQRPAFSWRHADAFREWWPLASPNGDAPVAVDLEDVAIVAALRAQNGVES
jgi:ABC-2 type transport system ATP-binding protein